MGFQLSVRELIGLHQEKVDLPMENDKTDHPLDLSNNTSRGWLGVRCRVFETCLRHNAVGSVFDERETSTLVLSTWCGRVLYM